MLQTSNESANAQKKGVGVIIARFQNHRLHEGHKELIESVKSRHQKTIVIIGLAPIGTTLNNPLNFQMRNQMMKETYGDVEVFYQKDIPDNNRLWSKGVDSIVHDNVPPESDVTLYGSRDSFIKSYEGRYKCEELIQRTFISATQERDDVGYTTDFNEDFRRGVIYATRQQYPTCFPTVDVAIVRKDTEGKITDLLLANKRTDGDALRFVGGFVQPPKKPDYSMGNALESQARREVAEETHVEVDDFRYLGSFMIDDWRYRNEVNKIVTTLFVATYTFGRPQADDDIDALKWISVEDLDTVKIQSGHTALFETVKEYIKQNNK